MRTDEWESGAVCADCGISFCAPHRPGRRFWPEPLGPFDEPPTLGIQGLLPVHASPPLDEAWALDHRMADDETLTPAGELVTTARDGGPGAPEAAHRLGRTMGRWVASMQHPTYQLDRFGLMALRRFDGVVPAPSSTGVPEILAEEIALATHSSFLLIALSARPGLPNMRLTEPGERDEILDGAYSTGLDLDGVRLLLVDDVVVSTATMRAAARTLKAAGASEVSGLAAVRAVWQGQPTRKGQPTEP